MKKIVIENDIGLYTVAFYNRMVKFKKAIDFYRISYYLYFLKKADNNIFKEEYYQTQSGICWPDNEKLMFDLVTLNYDDERGPIEYDSELITKDRELLIDNIYNQYKAYSRTKMQELVKEDIKSEEIFDNLPLKQQLSIALSNLDKYYQENPTEAFKLYNQVMKELGTSEKGSQKIYKIS